MTCIYFGDRENLTYKKQEHIFPAGLGGISKLPLGMVSDQANERFSPMEKILMKKSLVAMLRMHYGPGKRGSLLEKKAAQSQVVVTKGCTGLLQLTYTALSTPFSISQFTKDESQYYISLRLPQEEESEWEVFQEFKSKLANFSDKFVHLKSKELLEGQMIVGIHKDKLYCATKNDRPNYERIKNEISLFLENINSIKDDSCFECRMEQVKQYHELEENGEIARIYAKVAMNVLAYLNGENFVRNSALDEFRNWILYGYENQKFATLPNEIAESDVVKFFPQKAHWCLFTEHDGYPYATVCFYGIWQRSFRLTEEKQNWFVMPQGFLCDWENKREYTLTEYIHKFIDNIEDRRKVERVEVGLSN